MRPNPRTTTHDDVEGAVPVDTGRRRRRLANLSTRARRILAILVVVASVGMLAGLGGTAWYLDRFVIAHVEIADVSAYLATVTTSTVDEGTTTSEATGGVNEALATPAVTATSYTSGDASIDIDEVVVGQGDDRIVYFVADIVLGDATDLRAAFADDAFGTNILAATSDIAEDVGAVLAINGDYYGFRDTGIVIRNGVVYRDEGARIGLAMYLDGTMEIYDETLTTADELVAAGVWNTWSFGPALVDEGEIVEGIDTVEIDRYIGKRSMQGSQPRTAVGMIDEGHYVFVVVDGRADGYSRGMTLTELAALFQELGCTVAYNLDGGGSATMYFNGELVNSPVGRSTERGTSDILYIAA